MKTLKSAIESKKFIAFLGGLIVVLLSQIGIMEVDPTTLERIVQLDIGYLLGQGIADFGKEKAKVEKGTEL